MIEMPLIIPIWSLLLILSLLVLVIARMAEEGQAKYWVIIEVITFLCALWMWFFVPELEIVIW